MSLVETLQKRLAALDITLPRAVLESEVDFLQEMLRWNRTHNLTAITDPDEAVEKHLVDSLALLPYLDAAANLLDIGSGGGFPGIPLQIARPGLRVVSVDAVAKKIAFQRHAARKLKLTGFTPWHGRIEQVLAQPFAQEGFDLVVARAFAALQSLLELALPCLKPGGRIIAMKGPEGERELAAAGAWLQQNSLRCLRRVRIVLPDSGATRELLIFARDIQDVE